MSKEIIVSDRVRTLGKETVEASVKAAKKGTSGKTSFDVLIKRVANTIIIL